MFKSSKYPEPVKGDEWKRHRHFIKKTYYPHVVESFMGSFNSKTKSYIKKLRSLSEQNSDYIVDIFDSTMRCFMEVTCATMFQVDLNVQNEDVTFAEDLRISSHIMVKRGLNPLLGISDYMYLNFTEDGKIMKQKMDAIYDFTLKVVNDRRKSRKIEYKNKEKANLEDEIYGDILIELAEKENHPDKKLCSSVLDVLTAGTETPANMFASAVLMVAIHPEWQNKLQEEVDLMLGDDDRDLTIQDLNGMVSMDLVLKETHRIFPPMSYIREIPEDVKLGKHVIPGGSNFLVPVHYLHRDKKYWSHPNEFYPEHFLPENVRERPKGSYLPFSYGPRMCPGIKFSFLVSKIMFAGILSQFNLSSDTKFEDIKLLCGLTIVPNCGYKIKLTPRKKK